MLKSILRKLGRVAFGGYALTTLALALYTLAVCTVASVPALSAWPSSGRVYPQGPTLLIDFTQGFSSPTYASNVSFSRAGNAMQYDSTGTLTWGPNNLLTYSNTFTNGAWTTAGTTLTTGVSDPVGGSAATTFTSISPSVTVFHDTVSLGGANALNTIWMRRRTGTGTIYIYNAAGSYVPVTITGAWAQYASASSPGASASNAGFALITSGDAIDVYAPTLSAVTYETTPRSVDQVITTSAAYYGPRFPYAYNGSAWTPQGFLVEGVATNLYLNSGAPATQTVTVANATQYTVSFYGTGTLTLSGAATQVMTGSATPGALTSYTFTSSTTSIVLTDAALTSTAYPQVETGAIATSRVITGGSSATRAPDVAKPIGQFLATMLNPSFTAIVQTISVGTSSSQKPILQVTDVGGTSDRTLRYTNASLPQFDIENSGSTVVRGVGSAVTLANVNRSGMAVQSGNSIGGANGVLSPFTVGSATTTFPNPSNTEAFLGGWVFDGSSLNGIIQSVAVYNSRLPNATFQNRLQIGAQY